MNKQTDLIKAFVNPTFLEAMKQPVSSIECSSYYSFNMKRKGGHFHVTIYSGEEGQVNISSCKDGSVRGTIIRDYCQTLEDYTKLIENLDDLIERMPWVGK